MGVDARIAIKFSTLPSQRRVKELQFHLMHRFSKEHFWTKTLDWNSDPSKWIIQDFIKPIESGDFYFDSDADMTGFWEVSVYSRFYGEGYECGPGLELAGMCYFLTLQPDIEQVFYGGDSSGSGGRLMTEEACVELFTKYCRDGGLPYAGFFDHDDLGHKKSAERPPCSYCEVPMMRNGFGGRYAGFYCPGCGENLRLEGKDYEAWMKGEVFVGDRTPGVVAEKVAG